MPANGWFQDIGQSTVKQFYTSVKMANISHAYAMEPIVIFDLSRTQADKIDHVYSFIENLKNGIMFSPKYDSGTKIFKPPPNRVHCHPCQSDESEAAMDRDDCGHVWSWVCN